MAEAGANASLGRGGYDEEFVSAIEDEWECPVCQLPLKAAVQTGICGHRFCRQCLDEHFTRLERDGKPLTCPVDRNNLIRDKHIFPDKATDRKILSFIIKCPSEGCQWTGELRIKDNHLGTCLFKVVSCTNENCRVKLPRENLEEHMTSMCEWRILPCTHCSEPHPVCETMVHLLECRRFPLNCEQSCGAIIAREEFPSHFKYDCPLTIISCPYAEMGCTTKFQRKDTETHLQSAMGLHLDLACEKLKNTEVELKSSQEKMKTLEDKVDTRKIVWKIEEFSKVMREAKSGMKPKLESAPFYTESSGYKLKISVYPNGLWSGKNTHLSVLIIVMKGEYDAILTWPFDKKITFTLIDQHEDPSQRENVVSKFVPQNEINLVRPKGEENAGGGKPQLISHEKLQTRRYLVDDTLFLQVEVGPR